jgi:branched-chain amino acid transport system ATP-binding protein
LAPRKESGPPVVSLANVRSGYGKKLILNDVSLQVRQGEAITLIGHNGAGKTTTLRTIFGLQRIWSGSLSIDDSPMSPSYSSEDAVAYGVSMIPAERFVFADLTVAENLRIGARSLASRERDTRLDEAYTNFPILRERQQQ